jgi:outer membrane murein-binding lipoprotein Lpp
MRANFALGAATLGLLLTAGQSVSAEPASRSRSSGLAASSTDQDIKNLAATVSALESRVTAAEDQARAARDAAEAARARYAEQAQTLSASATTAAVSRNSNGLHYKGVTITLGGFVEGASIYRSRNDVSDISSNFSRIPFQNSPLAHTSESRGTARQSRLSLLIGGDINTSTHAAFYSEFDFQAGAQTSNSLESNSYVPRIRHVYGTLDWDDYGLHLLAGQNWSLVTMNSKGITPRNEVPPAVIDGQYVPGFVWARQPQIRVVKDWNQTFWAAISVENPQSTFAAPATGILSTASGITVLTASAGVSGFDSANSLSINHIPDVVGKLAYEPMFGDTRPVHMEVFGIWRSYSDRINVAAGNALGLPAGVGNAKADGGGVGAGILATVIPKWLDIQASVLHGYGIGRYGSAQLPDATLKPDGSIAPIHETIFLAGGTLHATPQLDLYVLGGSESQSAHFFDAAGGHFGLGNPAANLTAAACTTEGGTCAPNIRRVNQITAGFWHKLYTGDFGQVRFGAQYSHTELTAFAGASGYAPATSDEMVFTSLRYYPP